MTTQLIQTIRRVQDAIIHHSADFRNNETQTITSLINPILEALGWQISNLRQVRREFVVGRRSNRVDMALMKGQKPVVFLEAKALNTRLEVDQIEQISRYCFHEGVPNAILTNGEEWHLYRPQMRSLPFAERKLFVVQLGRDEASAESAAVHLSKLHRENIDQLEDETWYMLLERYWEKDAAAALLPAFTKILRQAIAREHERPLREVPPDPVRDFLSVKLGFGKEEPKPAPPQPEPPPQPQPEPPPDHEPGPGLAIVLDGQHIPLKYRYQILVEVANYLIQKRLLQPKDCPLRIDEGSRRFLIHTRPRHEQMNKPFRSPKRLANGLYIETHHSTQNIIEYSHLLLERYDLPADTIKIIGANTPKPKKRKTRRRRATPSASSNSAKPTLVLDKESFEFQYALDIPQIVARWLINRGQLRQSDCPIRVGKMGENRCLINTTAKHPDGTPFWNSRELPNGLFMECLGSKQKSIARARQLLQDYGHAPDTLQFTDFDE